MFIAKKGHNKSPIAFIKVFKLKLLGFFVNKFYASLTTYYIKLTLRKCEGNWTVRANIFQWRLSSSSGTFVYSIVWFYRWEFWILYTQRRQRYVSMEFVILASTAELVQKQPIQCIFRWNGQRLRALFKYLQCTSPFTLWPVLFYI